MEAIQEERKKEKENRQKVEHNGRIHYCDQSTSSTDPRVGPIVLSWSDGAAPGPGRQEGLAQTMGVQPANCKH